VYLLSGKRVTSSRKASKDSRAPFGSRSVMSWLADLSQEAEVFVEVDQPLQVVDVVDVRVVRVQLDEAVAGGNRRSRLLVFPVGVGDVDLRLLGVAAVGIARLRVFEVLDGLAYEPSLRASLASV
jgi:hypothetical protein